MAIAEHAATSAETRKIDCLGQKCPAPILRIATAAKQAGSTPTILELQADDPDFPKDVQAWCRTASATLGEVHEANGVFTTRVALNGAQLHPPAPPASHALRTSQVREALSSGQSPASKPSESRVAMQYVDCRGQQAPAPIRLVSQRIGELDGEPAQVEVLSDDADFPQDIRTWCKAKRHRLDALTDNDGVYRASIGVNGAPPPTLAPQPPSGVERRTSAAPRSAAPAQAPPPPSAKPKSRRSEVPVAVLDLRGLSAPHPILRLSAMMSDTPGARLRVASDDPSFMADVMAWSTATRATVLAAKRDGQLTTVELMLAGEAPASIWPKVQVSIAGDGEAGEALAAAALEPALAPPPAAPAQPAPRAAGSTAMTKAPTSQLAPSSGPQPAPREKRLTILVMKNDFESLMGAFMSATTAAAQGMEVAMFFSFWGLNVLRGERPRKDVKKQSVNPLQKMMHWMMPKGPSRQKMGKMHMGGMGKGMMQMFMRKTNVMSLEQLIASAAEQDVRFMICSTTMGIMGIQKRDIVELPNIEFAGLSSFMELSQRSSISLVF